MTLKDELFYKDAIQKLNDEQLGRAWARLNTWKWDINLGEKPAGFDDLPYHEEDDEIDKYRIVSPVMKLIETEFGERATSRAWWIYELGETEEAWKRWYFSNERKWRDETVRI